MSKGIFDPVTIAGFSAHPNNPFLVSFPRTGSAWLRMMVELALDRPTLTRIYYLQDRTDWLFLHTHDCDLSLKRESVIYLWRAPVETVYSQLRFEEKELDDEADIVACARSYAKHLRKWLVTETFTKKKTVVTYGQLQVDPVAAIAEIAEHCGVKADDERSAAAAVLASKEAMKANSAYDPTLVRTDADYALERAAFVDRYAMLVVETIFAEAPEVEAYVADLR